MKRRSFLFGLLTTSALYPVGMTIKDVPRFACDTDIAQATPEGLLYLDEVNDILRRQVVPLCKFVQFVDA